MLDEKIQDLIDVLKVQVAAREKDLQNTQGRRTRTDEENAVHDGLNASYDATISAFDELIDTSKLAIQLRKDMDELKELKATRIRSGATQGLIDNVRGNISQAASGAFGGLLPDAGIRNIITSVLPTLGSAVKAGFTGIMGGDTKSAIEKAELSIKINETSKSILARLKEQLDGLNDKIFSPDSPLEQDDVYLPTDQSDVGPVLAGVANLDPGADGGDNFVGSGNSDIEIAIGRTMLAVESSAESLQFLVDVVSGMAEELVDFNSDREKKELSADTDGIAGVASASSGGGVVETILGTSIGRLLTGTGIGVILSRLAGPLVGALTGLLSAAAFPVVIASAAGAGIAYFWDDITSTLGELFDGTGKERSRFSPDFLADGTYAPIGGIAGNIMAEEQLRVAKEQLNLTKEQIEANKTAAEKASQVLKDTIDKWLGRDSDVNQMMTPVNYALMGAVLSGGAMSSGPAGGVTPGGGVFPASATGDMTGGKATKLTGTSKERAGAANKFFTDIGWSPEAAAGIVGNLLHESGNKLDPNAVGDHRFKIPGAPPGPGDGRAYGIAQWRLERAVGLHAFAAKRGKPWNDFETQLAYVDFELKGGGDAGAALAGKILSRPGVTVAESTMAVERHFERPKAAPGSKYSPSIGTRIANANGVFLNARAAAGAAVDPAILQSIPISSSISTPITPPMTPVPAGGALGKSMSSPAPRAGGKPGQPQMTLVPAPYNGNEVFFNLTRAAQVGVGNTPFW